MSEARWYVAEVKQHSERLAMLELGNQKFTCLNPVFIRQRVVRRISTAFEVPLFPGYLFIQIALSDQAWGVINGTRGVKRILCGDKGRPSPLPVGVAAELLDRCGNGPLADIEAARETIRAGDQVLIEDGAFAGHVARCDWSDPQRDVLGVVIRWLNAERVIQLNTSAVSRSSAA